LPCGALYDAGRRRHHAPRVARETALSALQDAAFYLLGLSAALASRWPLFTGEDLKALGETTVELVDGDLHIRGINYGHGFCARGTGTDAPPPNFVTNLSEALRWRRQFETLVGDLYIGGPDYGRGW